MNDQQLSEREIRRFQQQIDFSEIGLEGQHKIKNARVLVIGAGGKGTAALKSLISAGVGYLGVSDDTLIQEETLSRQSLYNDTDLGKQKAIVSKQYLQARNRLTDIKVHNIRLTTENLNYVIANYDIIIDATNDFESHNSIEKAVLSENKPAIFSHIENNVFYITTLTTENTNMQNKISSYIQEKREVNDQSTPVVLVNNIAGVLSANEAINLVLQRPSQLGENMLVGNLSKYFFSLEKL